MMGDGAIKFITDSIVGGVVHDGNVWSSGTGESVPGSQSPYGLWGFCKRERPLSRSRKNCSNSRRTGGFRAVEACWRRRVSFGLHLLERRNTRRLHKLFLTAFAAEVGPLSYLEENPLRRFAASVGTPPRLLRLDARSSESGLGFREQCGRSDFANFGWPEPCASGCFAVSVGCEFEWPDQS